MGNKASTTRRRLSTSLRRLSFSISHDDEEHEKSNGVSEEVRKTFDELSSDKRTLAKESLRTIFGLHLTSCLWDFLTDADTGKRHVTAEEFYAKAQALIEMSKDQFIGILLPAERLLKVCFEVNDVKRRDEDGPFLEALIREMTASGDSKDAVYDWIEENCPHLGDDVHAKVIGTFGHTPTQHGDFKSTILTPVQILIMRNALPTTVYFAAKGKLEEVCKNECKCWVPLYISTHHGLSINRFETHVFHYRGPTVAIFRLVDGCVYAVACDDEWRYHDKRFGGHHSVLVRVLPKFKRFVSSDAPIYCNFKLHLAPFGIAFGACKDFHIDAEMDNVDAIEVWGCAGESTLHQQKEHKLWMDMEGAKIKKLDQWEEAGIDQKLLEMRRSSFANQRAKSEGHRRESVDR